MVTEQDIFQRAELLLGQEAMERLATRRVLLVGVGGVGSWCAEGLIRNGIRHLTLVDGDRVCASNVNRQLMATTETLGEVKVEALRRRLLSINPQADITAIERVFSEETASSFHLADFDYIIDAIDSLKDKALLIRMATETPGHLFSSMGAALKTDPTGIRVAEFWKVKGDPLARALRNRFKREKQFPAKKFQCVFSEEHLPPTGEVNGSLVHVTAVFGFTLASLVVNDVMRQGS
ncbi:MAG: tRNA threonylcarbamoyladenosine dehydratase [Bacteroidaceae bacterium]|nr:tRNA threonylcarbamoyladenosine dehydratase [Bacteroidaceae bacterium]